MLRVFIGSKINIGQDFYDSFNLHGKKIEISLLHLTYYFFGNIENKQIDAISKKMENLEYNKIHTKINGLDGFPNRNRAKIAYLTLDYNVIPLFQKIMETLDIKNRFFIPHITLYRMKKMVKVKVVHANYDVVIDSVCLYQSIFDAKRIYNPLYCIELK